MNYCAVLAFTTCDIMIFTTRKLQVWRTLIFKEPGCRGASTEDLKNQYHDDLKPKGDRNGASMVEAKNKLIYEIPEA